MNHRIIRRLVAAAVLLATLAVGAAAQEVEDGDRAEVRGWIAGSWTERLMAGGREHHFLVLRTEDGRRATVDLGPFASPGSLGIGRGDWIFVRGDLQRIGAARILVARSVTAENMTFDTTERAPRPRRVETRFEVETTDRVLARGTLERSRTARIAGETIPHTLLWLRTDEGGRVLVDLGPGVDLDRLGLRRGEDLEVYGLRGTIDGRPAVMASLVTVDGEPAYVTFFDEGSAASGRDRIAGRLEAGEGPESRGKILVEGRLVEYDTVDGRLILGVEVEPGEIRRVDVGDAFTARELDLREGAQVSVAGFATTLDGRDAILASNLRVDGIAYAVEADRMLARRGEEEGEARTLGVAQPREDSEALRGRVRSLRPARLEDRSIVRLVLEDGKEILLDLGADARFDDLDVSPGDEIRLRGRWGRLGDRDVFQVESFEPRQR